MPSLALGLKGQPRGGSGAAGESARPGGCGALGGLRLRTGQVQGGCRVGRYAQHWPKGDQCRGDGEGYGESK